MFLRNRKYFRSRPEVENIFIAFSILELIGKHVEVTFFDVFEKPEVLPVNTGSWKCYQKIRHTLISRTNILVSYDMALIGIFIEFQLISVQNRKTITTLNFENRVLTTSNHVTKGINRFLCSRILIWAGLLCKCSGHLGSLRVIWGHSKHKIIFPGP